MKFTEISNTKLTEAFDNPYPFELIGPNDSQEFSALAKTPNGMLRMDFEAVDYDNFGIDFSVGKSMGKTDAGDEFRVFATVVAMMKKWIKTVGIEHVESFDFGADKTDHTSDGRAKLYTRFAKQLASKLGWKLDQSTTGNGSTAFFKLVNPKPIPRDDAYWDALDEEVEVSLHGDAKKGYVLSKIEVSGDERNAGQGTKAMQDIVDRMDREGAIIALTPDDAFGGNKNRLIKFYKRFGFVPNKGRNKDFRFRETMIRYPQSNESVNEVSKEEFDAIQNGYVDIEFDKKWWPLDNDYPLIKHIGKAIGATSWTSWGKVGVPWSEKEMIGGGGTYMLKGDFGHILLDAAKSFKPEKILMSQISTSERGAGIGGKVMNAIKSYADQKGLPITIYKVTNKKFFDKFEWLTKTGEDTYEYKLNESVNEGYKLQLERDTDMMVLNITDTKTGKRTEVRGKSGYETNNYDANDKLHQLLDKISKSANISELMNGEVVGINPKHPDGPSAKTATTKAFNEAKDGLPVKTLKGLYHVGTLDASKKRDGYEGAGLSVSTHPDAWKQIARGHVTGDTHSATKEGNKFLDAHGLSDAHNEQIKQWALENDYLAQQETVTVCYYDDEMEDDLCSTFNSMADAEAEYDEELEHMDVSVDKGGIVPTDKLKKETRQNRIDSTGVLEFVLPIFAEQQGLDGVWWQDKLDVQRYSAPRGVIVPSKIKSWKFAVNETKAFNESLDNPYPYTWDASHDRYAELGNDSFLAKADMDMGELMVLFTMGRPGRSWTIDFAVDGTMQKTGDGDQFRTFATVVAVIKDWVANKVDLEKVTQIDFSSDKMGSTEEDSRGKLYKRFGQQLASKLGWTLEIKDRGHFADFKIKNPNAPVEESAGVGRVVKGVNTTVDVGVDEIIKQVKKFGNDVNRDGIPTKNLRTK